MTYTMCALEAFSRAEVLTQWFWIHKERYRNRDGPVTPFEVCGVLDALFDLCLHDSLRVLMMSEQLLCGIELIYVEKNTEVF